MNDRPSRLLLVRLREIGDVIFTTPAIRALRDRFPQARLSYLVEPNAAPVVSVHPLLDEVIVAPRLRGWRGLSADVALGRELRRKRFDIAIDFHGGPRGSLLTWLSRAPARIGYDIPGRSWMYTRTAHRAKELRARHSVENQWDLLTLAGVAAADRERYPVEMAVPAAAASELAATLAARGISANDRLVVMHVSAGNPFRRWPLPSFARVATALVNASPDIRVIVTSGPSEADAAGEVIAAAQASLADGDRHRVFLLDDLSLHGLRALDERAALFIGGDSGPMHVAATTSVPIVALYGPTLPARSEPWRPRPELARAMETTGLSCRPCEQRVCVHGDFRCLTSITPERVIDAAVAMLSRPPMTD